MNVKEGTLSLILHPRAELRTQVLRWGRDGDTVLPIPKPVEKLDEKGVVSLSFGNFHRVAVRQSGCVSAWGENEDGQVFPFPSETIPKLEDPRMLECLSSKLLVQASCGAAHTAVLSSDGSVFTFGNNEFGQLGHSATQANCVSPRVPVGIPSDERAIQVCCGEWFTIILTERGSVYSFGMADQGALGREAKDSHHAMRITGLDGVPVVGIGAGSNFAYAVTLYGSVYSWGYNSYGQLGHPKSIIINGVSPAPLLLQRLLVPIKDVSCGADHAALLATDGQVYVCGKGKNGQLGRRSSANSDVPVPLPLPGPARLVCCGRGFTLVVVDKEGTDELYAFGAGESGQLGLSEVVDKFLPCKVDLPPLLPAGRGLMDMDVVEDDDATATDHSSSGRIISIAAGFCDAGLVRVLSGGGRVRPHLPPPALYFSAAQLLGLIDCAKSHHNSEMLMHRLQALFSSLSTLNGSFSVAQSSDEAVASEDPWRIDFGGLEEVYAALLEFNGESSPLLLRMLEASLLNSAHMFYEACKTIRYRRQALELLRFVLIAFVCPMISKVAFSHGLVVKICAGLLHLPDRLCGVAMHRLLQGIPKELFVARIVRPLQEHAAYLFRKASLDWRVDEGVLQPVISREQKIMEKSLGALSFFLSILRTVNGPYCRLAPFHEFHNSALQTIPDSAVIHQHQVWRAQPREVRSSATAAAKHRYSVLNFAFLLPTHAKRLILQFEALLQMRSTIGNISMNFFFQRMPYLILRVRRDWLLQDALNQLCAASKEALQKPLKVVFVGEEGIDEGGLKKEFFQLLMQQLFGPEFGMFKFSSSNHTCWFNPGSLSSGNEFFLVGLAMGLAIYNQVLLDVRFPLTVFRKLLHQSAVNVTRFSRVAAEDALLDLAELDKGLSRGMRQLLDTPAEDVEDACLTFEATFETITGEKSVVPLVEGGSDISVTGENVVEFVQRYAEWMVHSSVKDQFSSFSRGFHHVMHSPSLALFSPEELELAVCGEATLDFEALERVTVYEGAYSPSHPLIQAFWRFVKVGMQPTMQQQFLKFVTGTARSPIGGLGKLDFRIQRAGPDSDSLPTAATCFNLLLLPEYSSPEKMQERLSRAISEYQGFGLQ